jgi:hypothetical protein
MKLIILHSDSTNKPSPISEGVAEIRIISQPCKGINPTTRHMQARRAPWVVTVHDAVKESSRVGSYLTLVPSSTRMPRRTHRGWLDTIPYNIYKEVGYSPTQRHVKLLSLEILYVMYASVHFKCLFIWTQPMQALIDTSGGYHLRASNIISDHSSSFPSNILYLTLIAPPGLQLYQPFDHLAKPHRTSIDRKSPIVNELQPFIFYR